MQGPQGLIKGGPPPRLFHTFSSHACVRLLRYVRNAVVLLLLTWPAWRGACCGREVAGRSRKTRNFPLSCVSTPEPKSSIRGLHFIGEGGGLPGLTLVCLVQTAIKQKNCCQQKGTDVSVIFFKSTEPIWRRHEQRFTPQSPSASPSLCGLWDTVNTVVLLRWLCKALRDYRHGCD